MGMVRCEVRFLSTKAIGSLNYNILWQCFEQLVPRMHLRKTNALRIRDRVKAISSLQTINLTTCIIL